MVAGFRYAGASQLHECEGEDKPLKYPTIFNTADVAIITKTDLADAVEFDSAAARKSIETVRPGMAVFELSAKSGVGMDAWFDFLLSSLCVGGVNSGPSQI